MHPFRNDGPDDELDAWDIVTSAFIGFFAVTSIAIVLGLLAIGLNQ
jgi:hypothetical protein